MNEEEIREYKNMLLDSNEIILFDANEHIEENNLNYQIPVAIFVIISIIIAIINDENLSWIGYTSSIIAIILYFTTNSQKNEMNKRIRLLNSNIVKHNAEIFKNFVREKLQENNLDKNSVNKEIVLINNTYYMEKILINDTMKTFNIVEFSIFPRKSFVLKKFNYSQMIKYDLIDNSTQTQIATSTISSNSGKALGGAVLSQLLTGEATTGAIIGGSGSKTSQTIYKTTINSSYSINIYLNQLENSIIHINSSDRKTIDDIISTLEYIKSTKETVY